MDNTLGIIRKQSPSDRYKNNYASFRKCEICKKEFKLPHLKQRFCSRKCNGEWRKTQPSKIKGRKYPHRRRAPIKTCLVCKKTFRAVTEQNGKFGGVIIKRKYCSRECWSKRNPPKIKACLICGKKFKTYGLERKTKIYCSRGCQRQGMIGRKTPLEVRLKMRKAKIGYMPVNVFKPREQHPFWISDRSKVEIRYSPEYKTFRKRIFKRDNHTCRVCGQVGGNLNIHHIKPHRTNPELIFDENNVVTLCLLCHKQTDSYLQRWGALTDIKAVKVKS